ncbi:MAG: sulfatase [Thermoanaerobaculales bacterium]
MALRWACGTALMVAVACGGGETPESLDALNGVLVAPEPVYVQPDLRLKRGEEGSWSFRKAGSVLVYVNAGSVSDLEIIFMPDLRTSGFHFSLSWDDQVLVTGPKNLAATGEKLLISSPRLGAGLHRLTITRHREADASEDREVADSRFVSISVRARVRGVWRLQKIGGVPGLSRFLDFGVVSMSRERLSGCFFVGPQTYEYAFSPPTDGEGSFVLENFSLGPAKFKISREGSDPLEFEVPSREREEVRFPVAAGRQRWRMEVVGDSTGVYLWGAPFLRKSDVQRRSPVVVITLDTTRRDAVSPYSDNPEVTPNIGDFAAGATVFGRAYTTSPWTLPSHASIFTGLYPSRHRAGVTEIRLADEWTTLAEVFRGAGYLTGGFAGGTLSSSRWGLAQGFSVYRDPDGFETRGDVLADAAISFIEDHDDQPLFLFVNFFDPHGPYKAPRRFRERVGVETLREAVLDLDGWGDLARGESGAWAEIQWGRVGIHPAGIKYLRATYLAEVAFMDHQIGRLFRALRRLGLYEEALIVLVADHGELLGEGGRFSHSYVLDTELTHIPLLIKWPHQREPRVSRDVVSLVDLYPTIASAAGVQPPAGDGILLPAPAQTVSRDRRLVYMEEHSSLYHQLSDELKVADHLFGRQHVDSREIFWYGGSKCSRLLGSGSVEEECASPWIEMIDRLPDAMKAAVEAPADFDADDISDEEAQRLRALGYLQ